MKDVPSVKQVLNKTSIGANILYNVNKIYMQLFWLKKKYFTNLQDTEGLKLC